MTFTSPYKWRQEIALPAIVIAHYKAHYLFVSIANHLLARDRRICPGCPGIQKSQEIKDFRNGSDCRARIVSRSFLLNGNDRAEAVYLFHLWLFQHSHKVLGISGQRIHVTPLSFRIYRIEGQ